MRRLMFAALFVGLGLSLGLTGCGEKSSVESEKTIETPQGSTTIKEESTVKQNGENPPPVTAEPAK